MSKVIVDVDSMIYAVGFASNGEPERNAFHTLKIKMKMLQNRLALPLEIWMDRAGYMTDREKMYPDYKGTRVSEKPEHYHAMRQYLKKHWGAQEAPMGLETDDIVAIRLTQDKQAVLAGIDKDLLQVPGMHYNWNKDALVEIDEYTADYNLYTQCLVGDTSDNVPGLPGVGPKGSAECLDHCTDTESFQRTCLDLYEEYWGEVDGRLAMDLTMHLLYLKRSEEDVWQWLV